VGMPRGRRLVWVALLTLALPFGFYVHPLLPLAALLILDWRRWRGAEIVLET